MPAFRRSPVRVALVADDGAGAIAAMGGVPLLPSQVVLIWRVSESEAQRGLAAGDYDCVAYGRALRGTPATVDP